MSAHAPRVLPRRAAIAVFGVILSTAAIAAGEAPPVAQAGGDVDLELTLLHGTNQAAAAIPPGWPELGSPPFNAYNHYAVVTTKSLVLKKGTLTKESLPDGSTLEANVVETAPKAKLELVLRDAKGGQVVKGTYSLPKGKRHPFATTPYKGGSLVIGLRVP
jgi:hypothetical protein